jgi:integrase
MLTAKQIEHAKPREKDYKLYDEHGLVLLVTRTGAKYFRFKYNRPSNGKENWISLGVSPEVTLAAARVDRDEARKLVKAGKDPSLVRKAKKLTQKVSAANDFESIAREFFPTRKYCAINLTKTLGTFEKYVFPRIGKFAVAEITPPQLLAVVQPIDALGKIETAHRILASCGQVFRYAVRTGRCASDPTRDLRGALSPHDRGNFAAITNPEEVGPLLRMIDSYQRSVVVRCALQLAPRVFVRPGELREAKWEDFDLEKAEWCFWLSKRKRGQQRRQLIVPLSSQVLEILRNLKAITGNSNLVFPSLVKGKRQPISNGTVNGALRALGIPKEEMCGHGFRAMARTILAEVLHVPAEIIEHQLGHAVRDSNGTAYNRTSFLPERRKMMQDWADYLDVLKAEIL